MIISLYLASMWILLSTRIRRNLASLSLPLIKHLFYRKQVQNNETVALTFGTFSISITVVLPNELIVSLQKKKDSETQPSLGWDCRAWPRCFILPDGHSLLDQVVAVLWQLRGHAPTIQDKGNLVASDEANLKEHWLKIQC